MTTHPPDSNDAFRFAAVSYVNAAPLAHYIDQADERATVLYDKPSHLIDLLLAEAADAALVPVVDYFAHPQLAMIDGIGICADGDVESVLLKCRRPIDQVQCIAADPASRTSNALAQILMDKHFGRPVRMVRGPAAAEADAEVVIGDRALLEPAAPSGDYDLAGLWKAMTGLPFVFAVWAYPRDHRNPDALARILHKAMEMGMAAVDQLAAIHAPTLGLPASRCCDYLSRVIRYEVGPRQREAMDAFRRLLDECRIPIADEGAKR